MRPEETRDTESMRAVSRLQTFSAFKYRDYRYHWTAHGFSNLANWIQQVTLAVLVWELTSSSFWVGTVLGIRALPILLIGPLAGVAVDRFNRKSLLMFTQFFLAGIAFLFAVGLQLDVVKEDTIKLYATLFSFLLGVDLAVNQPARQSLVANVVPRDALPNAIAWENSSGTMIRTIAPILGLQLLTPFGFAGNFFLQAAAYLAVVLIIIPMRTPYREGYAEGTSMVGNLMEGLRYIRTDTILLLLIALIIIPSVFVHSTQNLLVIFAGDILAGDDKVVLGLLFLSMGIGSLVAIFAMASLGNFQRKGLLNTGSILLVTILLIFFGLSSHLLLSLVLIGLIGMFNMGFHVANSALVQTRIPDALRGRITSIYLIDHGAIPLGSILLGLLAEPDILGPGTAVSVAGLLALAVTAFIALRWRQLWRLR